MKVKMKPFKLRKPAPPDKDFLNLYGIELLQLRRDRLREHRTTSGAPLLDGRSDKYSPSYEKKKRKSGRAPYSSGDVFVWTGDMLQSMQVQVDGRRVLILFSHDFAARKAWSNNLRREFIRYTPQEFDLALNFAKVEWKRLKGIK